MKKAGFQLNAYACNVFSNCCDCKSVPDSVNTKGVSCSSLSESFGVQHSCAVLQSHPPFLPDDQNPNLVSHLMSTSASLSLEAAGFDVPCSFLRAL